MKKNPLILMVTESAAHFNAVERALVECGSHCELRRVSNISMALARVAGGGVKSIVADCSEGNAKPGAFSDLRIGAQGLPVLLWSDSGDLIESAFLAEAGATGWLTPNTPPLELKRMLLARAVLDKGRMKSVVIAVMGAKGGVGTTTVAMNLAACLADRGSAVLAEVRPTFGSLQEYFHPGRLVRGLGSLNEGSAASSVLWPVPGIAGLRILFGPQTVSECRDLTADQAVVVLNQLTEEAEFVIVDIPVSLAAENRAILGASHYLVLVVEPTSACMRLSKLTLEGVQSLEKAPSSIGAVVVKRKPEGTPFTLADVEADLGVPILKVIPPAEALCVVSEQAHAPMVQCDPESLATDSLMALARCFHPGAAVRAGR